MKSLEIVYKNEKPYGIRDSGGFLLFFPKVDRYPDQNRRYLTELSIQMDLAKYLLEMLKLKER